jgi:hypothetical protein
VELIVHVAVQNLNILSMKKLIQWCEKNNYYLDYQLVTYPEIFNVNNLPEALINKAKEDLLQLNSKVAQELLVILNQPLHIDLWNKLQTEIDLRDSVRNTSIINVIPEFKDHLHAKKD